MIELSVYVVYDKIPIQCFGSREGAQAYIDRYSLVYAQIAEMTVRHGVSDAAKPGETT